MRRIKGGIEGVEVFGIEGVLGHAQGIRKALVVYDLPLTQELDGILNVGIIDKAQDVVVGDAGFLLCCNRKSTSFCAAEQ